MTPLRAAGLTVLLLAAAGLAAGQRDCYGAPVEVAVLLGGQDRPLEAFYGYPAPFGAFAAGALNDTAWPPAPLAAAQPLEACGPIAPAPQPGAAALVTRGNCSFADKAWQVQKAGYAAMLLFNTAPECVFMQAWRNETQGLTLAVVSVTRQAGAALQAALAAHPPGQLAVRLRMPAEGSIDWSSAALWVLATGTVTLGALWAGYGHWAGLGRDSDTPKKGAAEQQVPTITIGASAAVGFVVLASSMLLLLFFFLDRWLAYILVGLFGLGAWQAVSMVLYSLLHHFCSPRWRALQLRLPAMGPVPASGVAAVAGAALLCATWAANYKAPWSWPLQDVMGVCFMLVILKQFYLPNLKVATLLLCLAFVYDVWWVFLQPMVTGGASVMIEVATGGAAHEQLPMVLRVPHHALGTNPAFAILGLGDVVLPGLLAVFCRRFDLSLRLPVRASYLLPCVLGYAGGMLATYCALWFSWFGDQGQPALLYLVPGTLGTTLAMGTLRGQLGALWSCDFEAWADEEYAAERRRRAAAAEEEQMREAEAGLEHHLMPSGHFAGPSSPSRERLLPASPFERSRSGSRSDGAN